MKNKLIAASPRAFDLRWEPPVKVEDLQGPVFFGAVAGAPRKGVIARAKWGEETLYLLDRGESTRLPASVRNADNKGQKSFRFRENFRDLVLLDRSDFDGPAYDRNLDRARLAGQILRVYELMSDGRWRTLDEIAQVTCDPPASVCAQLRHLRKVKYGSHHVEKRRRGEGLWEYRVAGGSS